MLYITATPIGNLEDITIRTINTLKNTDIVLVESFKDSIKLLNKYDIKPKQIIVYNDSNKAKASKKILEILKNNDAAFITSAGTPGISDPGNDLAALCYEFNIKVLPLPGASALTAAVSVSGIKFKHLVFLGFLPKKKSKVEKLISRYLEKENAVVFYESPYRILKSLELIISINEDIEIFIAKEMTKKFETYLRGNIKDVYQEIKDNKNLQKGEFTVILKFTKQE